MKDHQEEFYPAALTIAGSDSGGGAGIQADLRTFNAAGIFGCSAITAVAAQNPFKLCSWKAVDPELVADQINAVFEAVAIKAVKIGMCGSAENIKAAAFALKNRKVPLIIDPVVTTLRGTDLLDKEGLQALKELLLPMAGMIMPDIPNAEILLGRKLKNEPEYISAARELAGLYSSNVLLRSSHTLRNGSVGDVAVLAGDVYLLTSPELPDISQYVLHGCGCTFSSAVTAMLACGNGWKDAVKAAKAHVYGALSEAACIGKGLEAMYPPLEDYSRAVALRRVDGKPAGKGGKHVRKTL